MKRKVLSIVSSLLILALTLNFTPVLAKDVTMVKTDIRKIPLSEVELPIQHPTGPELTPEIDDMDYDLPKITPGHFELEEESSAEREYIPPSPEDLAETARMVQSFDCSTVTDVPEIECEALVALYESTNGAGWIESTNWLNSETAGNWYGVTVSDGHVTDLYFGWNNLKGTIPAELGDLNNLVLLDIEYNELSGTLPSSLKNLSNLKTLRFPGNQLSGEIPDWLGSLTNISTLSLSSNNFSGSIPAELGSMTNLKKLHLQVNRLTGPIPSELGSLTNLELVNLESNQLSGVIPTELGNMVNLKYLHLFNNQLTGNIPITLGNLTNLTIIDLSSNQLTGSIPMELGSIETLEWLLPVKSKDNVTEK